MKCSTESNRDIRGFNFLLDNCDKEYLTNKFQEFRKLANETGKTYIIRLADSNYYRFEIIMVPNSVTLLSIATARGVNNINLRDFSALEELATLSCCAYQNDKLKELALQFLGGQREYESEVVDLEEKTIEIEISPDCSKIEWNELKMPEQVEGKWTTTELAYTDRLYLKALAGQAKFITISTERPQNSIKFNSFERLNSLCCFVNIILQKLKECNGLVEALTPFLHQESGKRKRRKNE
ncbi:hypothetical protein EWF20_12980 [Sulfolobus sp. S-194]|uniref:hypothetical protein n=1 Tax=Sulfolobus sp. S-194 TaxID=2512240 RepID=UPI001436FF88|nr:hypothetical protein [Sulfolobus sp. S-194]QIW24950.1 hypothetical protein EWF20_12980 [Sulfolobus sp. S-194]